MPNRIAGITVEINGSTTGLSKALESVNKTIKNTQSQLKDVERLLKLDPTNTELLSQKQEKLKTAISATKEKLDALKQAQEQAKAQMESGDLGKDKYDALQREIIATEEELKRLAKEAAEANTALTKIGNAGQTLENVGNKMSSVGSSLTRNVTAPILALGTAAVKTTADFDASMSQVAAVSGAVGDDFDALRAKAREMGAKTKFSASEAADAMNYMAMAGWKTGDMLSGIEGIMNLAAASGEDLATTSDIVTDALTAFGMTAQESGHFADVLAAASSNANTNVSMLGESFKYAAPVAGALGMSAEDTSIALGLMANAGIKASQSGTALRTGLTNLAKPTKQMQTYMDRYNIALVANEDGSINLRDTMVSLREKMGDLSETEQAAAASAIFGKNSMAGWLAIINASDDDFNKLTSAIDGCDGAAQNMAETMQDNLSGQITILKSALQELMIQIGDALMPTIRNIVSHIQAFVEKLQQMDEGTRNTILRLAAFAAAIGPVLLVVGKLTTGIGKGLQAVSSLGKGILTFVNQAKLGVGAGGKLAAAIAGIGPVGWAIIAVVAALSAAFVHLWKNNEEFRDKITGIWEGIREKLSEAMQKITDAVNKLGFNFKDITEVMKAAWDGFCDFVAPVLEGAFKAVGEIIEGIIDVVTGVIEVVVGLINGFKDGDWSTFTQGLLDIINGVVNAIWGVIQGLFRMFGIELDDFNGDWGVIWDGAKAVFTTVWTAIRDFFIDIWNGIKSFFEGIWNGLKNTVTTIGAAIGAAVSNAWNAVKTTFTNVWNAISDVVSSVWETIKNVVTVGIMFVKELFSAAFQILTMPFRFIWENCKDAVIGAWDGIKSGVSSAIDWVQDKVSIGWNAVKSTTETIWNGTKDFVSATWENIKTAVSSFVDGINEKVSTVWDSMKTTVSTIMDGLNQSLFEKWEAAKAIVSTVADSIKAGVSEKWEATRFAVSTTVEGIRTDLSEKWEAAREAVSATVEMIRDGVLGTWDDIKTTLAPVVDGIQSNISTAWEAAKDTVNAVSEAIKSKTATAWDGVKSKIVSAVDGARNSIATGFEAARNMVTNVFEAIRSKITSVMDGARNSVTNAINAIKNKFNFSWSLPHLKLPHLSISGSFSIDPPSVPHFSISWYKKAMEDGMILNSPTIFGQKGNTLLAGGEAGSETVVGTRSLMEMIRNAVASMANQTTINYGGVNINLYAQPNQDIRALADEIEYRINNNVMRRRAAVGT